MTFRIDSELLKELKEYSQAEGRSTSAEVVWLIRQVLHQPKNQAHRPTMGMFKHLAAPTLREFVEFRRATSKKLVRTIRQRAKRL